jgi:hypothetical protein
VLKSAIVLGVLVSVAGAASALAGPSVDPTTLTPQPPPGAVCKADGRQVICNTFVNEAVVNQPQFALPCGTVYETSTYQADGMRWYADNLLVKRQVNAHLDGTWSLSPTGAEPRVQISGGWSFWTYWLTPGDDSTTIEIDHGNDFKASAPGFGVLMHDTGLVLPDGTHHGNEADFSISPATASALCAALV